MTAPLVVPFNFQPESVSVKTGAYAIPAGKYAFVSASCHGSGSFSIGGAVALKGSTFTTTSQTATTLDVGDIITGGGPGSEKLNHLKVSSDIPESSFSNTRDAFSYGTSTHYTDVSAGFWVPAGTSLSSAGDARYTVSIYNNIT